VTDSTKAVLEHTWSIYFIFGSAIFGLIWGAYQFYCVTCIDIKDYQVSASKDDDKETTEYFSNCHSEEEKTEKCL